MSRFSKSEAEELGWVFVHKSPARIEFSEGDPQGRSLRIPASVRAEKRLPNGKLINEEAETTGLLLERIYAYERQRESKLIDYEPFEVDESVELSLFARGNEGDFELQDEPVQSVLLPDGSRITEAEWSKRDSFDSVYDKDGQRFVGPPEDAVAGVELKQEIKRDAEDAEKAALEIATAQLDVDNHDSVDSPGQGAPSNLTVRKGEAALADVSLRKDADEAAAEDARVQAAQQAAEKRKAEEEAQ